MIRSMTAYARDSLKADWGEAVFEIRSVNHRYLETSIRLPEQCRNLERILRERFKQVITRGKIECQLHLKLNGAAQLELFFNEQLAQQIIATAIRLQQQYGMATFSPIDVLRWPGVMAAKEPDLDYIATAVLNLFDQCLTEFIRVRKREGQALKALIVQRLQLVEEEITRIATHLPAILGWQKEKLMAKLNEVGIEADTGRFEQEVVLIAQRIDVAEELDRLKTHCQETYRILQQDSIVGRHLDFMMQEFNRESNTIASKSINSVITSSAIELKVLIEQMREQIQNME